MKHGAVVLFSAGLDSAVCLAMALREHSRVLAVTFDYEQTNAEEIQKAQAMANNWRVPHRVIDLSGVQGNANIEIPARNSLFLAYGLKEAIEGEYRFIYFGAEPQARYIDSSAEFIDAQRRTLRLFGVELRVPVKAMANKAHTLSYAFDLGVPIDLVHSCRNSPICFDCSTCKLMLDAFAELFGEHGEKIYRALLSGELHGTQFDLRPRNPALNFKAISALFEAARFDGESLDVFTTGNWGRALAWAFDYLGKPVRLNIRETSDVASLKSNVLNTNTPRGLWGAKQSLSRLPRNSGAGPIAVRVTQGNLRTAALDLGQSIDPVGGQYVAT